MALSRPRCLCGRAATILRRHRTGGNDWPVTIDSFINVLAAVTLFEMTVTIGLAVTLAEIAAVARDWRVVTRRARFAFAPGSTGRHIDSDVSDRRHRQPARRCHPGAAA